MAPMMEAVGFVLRPMMAGKVSVVLVFAIPVLVTGMVLLTIAAGRYSLKLRNKIDVIKCDKRRKQGILFREESRFEKRFINLQ